MVYTTLQGQVHPYLQRDIHKQMWSDDTHILGKVIRRGKKTPIPLYTNKSTESVMLEPGGLPEVSTQRQACSVLST